ncbi:MAG: chromosome segregation protein SMC [Saprospiraceae bacterium]|jgi:chromosome segregation protein|nr:chromosome segregation protein SMC [Saprospiraceae bacterium]MBK8511360.1 chromosome segregation protein SMC [Saprospiraceae bacterium]MBK9679622.1 chromosome segregation protein SMC [Saprospiraceae bacterium]MBK9931970.1 chromosome segregation protein SMC [Saprospiraceae bacterium]MBP9745733.1 chromosome segregation protein SMC [Saprospiraceae bacterium]
MQLNSIEIKGFKSFADNTVLKFNEKVTGVVGPNGSGKSNVVDAIRWVLGEQKPTELRLERMTDVIFNGSKKRKPGGVAQVSLSFDNTKNLLGTEYQQVTISRLLYRSGESEYRINGTACRLRDIHSLFMDTGIGSNSYAIIALGMVDEILQDKDHSRRKMFEQAAGVTKYKQRKHETMLKLKATEEDLSRVDDILFEIEANLKALEKQASRAEKYIELKEQYKNLSLELAYLETQDILTKNVILQKNLVTELDKLRTVETNHRTAESSLEAGKKAILDEEHSLSSYQKELNAMIHQLQNLENSKRISDQKLEFLSTNRAKLSEQKETWISRLSMLDQEIINKNEVLEQLKISAAELHDLLAKMELERSQIESQHGEVKSSFEVLQKEQQEIEKDLFEKEKQLAINQNKSENLEQSLARIAEENVNRDRQLETIGVELEGLRDAINQVQAELTHHEAEELNRVELITELNKKLDQTKQVKAGIERKLDAKQNEHQLLKSMVDSMEGYPDSIRFLHKNWKEDLPLLADLIYAPEEYRATIEQFLEPYLSHYIVDTYEDAGHAIRMLSDAQKGKANFFVLEAITPLIQSGPMRIAGLISALDVLRFDSAYANLFNRLFQHVFIDPNPLDKARFKEYDENNITILSANGSYVKRQFALSGGSVGLFEGKKLGRRKNLEILEEEIKQLEEEHIIAVRETNKLELEHKALDHQEILKAIESTRLQLERKHKDEIQLHTRYENLNELKVNAAASAQELIQTQQTIQHQNLEINDHINQRRNELNEMLNRIVAIDSNYQVVAQTLTKAHEAFNQKQIDAIRHQSKIDALVQDIDFQTGRRSEAEQLIDKLVDTQSEEDGQREKITAELEGINEQLRGMYIDKQTKESGLNVFEQEYFKKRNGIHQQEQILRDFQREEAQLQNTINGHKDQIKDLEFRLETVKERLKIEFNIEVLPELEPMTEIVESDGPENATASKYDLLKDKVRKLKDRIENYGEINPMAVEAYREMKERYDNIFNQRQDILNAKESLLATIQEIDISATSKFLEAFGKVREHFIRVFRSLFTAEDSCDLILLNPDQPLESDIDIIAKPKGKLPKSLSQLSGGEKTLTATALLFALYLLKPAPFCIFDEVDAPLDDSNIEKFNNIIRDFAEESQFIIVTHNKQTMAAVDVIYGVFMEEVGVSKVSAVDFREFEHMSLLETSAN